MRKWWNSRISFVCASLLLSSIFVLGINYLITFLTKPIVHKESSLTFSDFSNSQDLDIRNYFKNNTISLSIIEKNTKKTNGTAWLLDWNHNTSEYTFVTNLHVFSNFIYYNSDSEEFNIDRSKFEYINIKFFNNVIDQDLTFVRTTEDDWNIDKINKNIFIKRNLPINYKNISDTKLIDNKLYIENGFVDYIKLTYKADNDSLFDDWLKTHYLKPDIMNVNDLTFPEIDNFYIAGFPIINSEPKWVEQKIELNETKKIKVDLSNTISELSPMGWIDGNKNIQINTNNEIIRMRSVSRQIIIEGLKIGAGSSGSMMITKQNNKIKILGIWWGTYGNHSGGIDVLRTNTFKPYQSHFAEEWKNIIWEGYSI